MKAMLIASLLISAPEDLPGHREGHPKRVAKTLEHGDPLPCCAQTRDATASTIAITGRIGVRGFLMSPPG